MAIGIGTAMLAGAAIQGAVGIGQLVTGAVQRNRARKELENLEDPTMEMPSSINEMINLARQRQEMPGLDTMKNELGATTGRGLTQVSRAARTPGELARATTDLYAEEMRGARQLDIAGAEYRAARERQLMGALQTKGGFEQEMFRVNELMPYQRRLQQYMQQAGVGGQNIAAGIGTMVQGATGYLENSIKMQMHNDWMDVEKAKVEAGLG